MVYSLCKEDPRMDFVVYSTGKWTDKDLKGPRELVMYTDGVRCESGLL